MSKAPAAPSVHARHPLFTVIRVAIIVALAVTCQAASATWPAAASDPGIVATVTYTGNLGPVSNSRPLCLCVYADASLQDRLGCFISGQNGATFPISSLSPTDYFFIAFLDPNFDEVVNSDEPFGIYNDRTTPPADPVTAAPDAPAITIMFGDQSLTPTPVPSFTPTETPTATDTPSPTATPSPTLTPTPQPCAGDCDGSGEVTVDEILTLVNVALGNTPLEACANADTDGSGAIEVTEILAAVNHALLGCQPNIPGV